MKTTTMQYRIPLSLGALADRQTYPWQPSASHKPNERSDVIDESRQLCRKIAELALEARWTQDPRAIALALHLLARQLRRVSALAKTMGAVV
jgi:hypothetical protein